MALYLQEIYENINMTSHGRFSCARLFIISESCSHLILCGALLLVKNGKVLSHYSHKLPLECSRFPLRKPAQTTAKDLNQYRAKRAA